MSLPYSARFSLDGGDRDVAAVQLDLNHLQSPVPPDIAQFVVDKTACDIAFRLRLSATRAQGLLFLSNAAGARDLPESLQRLGQRPGRVALPSNAQDFDALTGAVPQWQCWLNQASLHAGEHPVAADYRLLPHLDRLRSGLKDGQQLFYQSNFRRYAASLEVTRAVKKYIARIELDAPFPAEVTALQSALASRLIKAEFLADELLGASDAATLSQVESSLRADFDASAGSLGFAAAPIDFGRFDELWTSGLHSSWLGISGTLPSRGAAAFEGSEVFSLLTTAPRGAGSRPIASGGHVFISYSSSDFVHAQATMHHLEAQGIPCWIAPRDIQPGEPYPDAILRGIERAFAVVILLSEASNRSPHVIREVERALNRKATIIPFRLAAVHPSGSMEYLLATCHWVDAFTEGKRTRLDPGLAILTQRLVQLGR